MMDDDEPIKTWVDATGLTVAQLRDLHKLITYMRHARDVGWWHRYRGQYEFETFRRVDCPGIEPVDEPDDGTQHLDREQWRDD